MNKHTQDTTHVIKLLCMGCMQERLHTGVCQYCGFDDAAYQQSPASLPLKTHLCDNRYIVGKVLGQGGFGITYSGFDSVLRKKVAIKEYFPSTLVARDTKTVAIISLKHPQNDILGQGLNLFLQEARTLARFSERRNIVNVYDFFKEHRTGYMVMNFVEGQTLEQFVKQRGGKLALQTAISLLLPLLDALKAIHAEQLYHRDISPQNIMVTPDGVPVLIDFGCARQIVRGQSESLDLVLKQGYSPIESYATKGKIGPWTDIYACGATLYFMLTGKAPPPSPDRMLKDLLVQPADIAGLRDQVSAKFNDTMLRALAVKSDERFKNVVEFRSALQASLPHKPAKNLRKKHYGTMLMQGIALLAALALGGYAAYQVLRPQPEEQPVHIQASTPEESRTEATPATVSTSIPTPRIQPTFTPQQSEYPVGGTVVTESTRLNIRKGPGTDTDILGKAQQGEELLILEEVGEWYKVKLNRGLVGYAHKDYISISNL